MLACLYIIRRTKEDDTNQDSQKDRMEEQRNQDLATRKRKFELLQNPLAPEENEDKWFYQEINCRISEDPLLQFEEDDTDKGKDSSNFGYFQI